MAETEWLTVLVNIVAMFLVILVGWMARKHNFLSGETTTTLSKFVVDITIPAMIFSSMLRTVDADSLRTSWLLPLLGIIIISIGQLIGWILSFTFQRPGKRATFIFLVAVANWIYLPLPIAQQLYGDDGVRVVLLVNVGAQIILWTLGIWVLRQGKPDWTTLRNLITNPGLIATFIGIIIAILFPNARLLETSDPASLSILGLLVKALISALVIIGSLTIPLSLVVTGAQLGGLDLSDHRPSRELSGVIVSRLLLAPVGIIAAIWMIHHYLMPIPDTARMISYIIALMPVAVSCSMFTERFGGDTSLAARAIFYTTLFSICTVPLIFYLVSWWKL